MGRRFWVELSVIVAVLIWGCNIAVMKGAFGEMHPMAYNFGRYALSAAIFIAIMPWLDRDWLRLSRRDWWLMLGAAALGVGVHQPFWMWSLTLTYAANSAIIVNSSPLFVLLFAWLRRSDPPNRWSVGGFLVSFLGVLFVVVGSAAEPRGQAPNQILGDLLTIFCSASWAGYIMLGDPLMRRHSPLRVTAVTLTVGTFMFTLTAWPWVLEQDWTAVSLSGWWAVFYGGALSSVLCYLWWFQGVQTLGPVRLMAYQFAVAAISVVAGSILLSEPLNPAQIVGLVVVVSGIALTRWPTIALMLRARSVRPVASTAERAALASGDNRND